MIREVATCLDNLSIAAEQPPHRDGSSLPATAAVTTGKALPHRYGIQANFLLEHLAGFKGEESGETRSALTPAVSSPACDSVKEEETALLKASFRYGLKYWKDERC